MATISYLNGSDITLLVEKGNKWVPTLGAKSHKISSKSNSKEIVDKDTTNSLYKTKSVNSIEVTLSVDGFVKIGTADDGIIASELYALHKEGKPVKLRYGYRSNAPTDATYEEGMFLIVSIEMTHPAKEEATYSASFSNTGEIKTVKATPSSSGSTNGK